MISQKFHLESMLKTSRDFSSPWCMQNAGAEQRHVILLFIWNVWIYCTHFWTSPQGKDPVSICSLLGRTAIPVFTFWAKHPSFANAWASMQMSCAQVVSAMISEDFWGSARACTRVPSNLEVQQTCKVETARHHWSTSLKHNKPTCSKP